MVCINWCEEEIIWCLLKVIGICDGDIGNYIDCVFYIVGMIVEEFGLDWE